MNREKLNDIMVLVSSLLTGSELSFRCIEAEWNQHDRILRLFIDRPVGSDLPPVGMDDCVTVTRALNESTEVEDLIKGAFNLEVSSPGVERPLRLIEDFLSNSGEQVEVRFKDPVDGSRKLTGELLANQADDLQVKLDERVVSFSLENVLKAHVLYDWSK